MKINQGIKWVAIASFAAVGLIFMLSGTKKEGAGEGAKSEEFQRRNSDFDRFSAIRGEGNTAKLVPIADESAQKALGAAPANPPVAVPQAVAEAPKPAPEKPGCASAWNADESCVKTATAKPVATLPIKINEPIVPEAAPVKSRAEKSQNIHLASTLGPAKAAPRTTPSPGGKRNLADYEEQLIAMSSAKANVVTGRNVKSNTDILKKGSRYLGIISEAMIVRTGEKHDVTIDVIARLSNNTTVKPFLLYGSAELNRSGTRIVITVTDCIAADAAAESIPCKGDIKDHRGVTGLDGVLYNPNHYANALKFVASVVGGGFVALKTTSRTLNGGVLYDQTFGNATLDALAASAQQAGADEAEELKSEGKKIEIAPGAIVQVLISQDVALW